MNKTFTDKQALFWEKTESEVKCGICSNNCILPNNTVSRCSSRMNINGEMKLLNYGKISSIAVDPIEKKPLYHFYPGTKVLSVGGWGCNFKCLHCQNWQISQSDEFKENSVRYLSPERLIELAKESKSSGIAWTYNEPTVDFEYTLDCAKLAKQEGLYTVYVTNGYISKEALDCIAPYLDAFRVDIKSFEDSFYQEISAVKSYENVLNSTLIAKSHNMHIECITNIIPNKNDNEENLEKIAKWIEENLGNSTPWHVTKFHPANKLSNIDPTPIETLKKAYKIGKQNNLSHVYLGNVGTISKTICPQCNATCIERDYVNIFKNYDKKGNCLNCNADINIKC